MKQGDAAKKPLVVFCGCAYYDVIPKASKEKVLNAIAQAGVEVEVLTDLCGLAVGRDGRFQRWAQAQSVTIVACFPRTVRWLFEVAGTPLDRDKVRILNMRTQSPDEIISDLLDGHRHKEATTATLPEKEDGWIPWFPVIDYDRCRNCKQCLNFCLFGVYGLSGEGRVEVQKPAGCKTNCPACARICPEHAIIFPKYAESPINGDEVTESSGKSEKSAPDLRSLLKGDVYDKIRKREPGRKRFSTEPKAPSSDQPTSSLEGLRQELDIPQDVLASLSPAELQRIRKTSRPEANEP
jgi:NAD-dependent dihydropyrimidine dehydrogenase PreA subunit